MNSEPGDYKLALRAQRGDRDALAERVARTRLRLFALAYAELRHYDDAQAGEPRFGREAGSGGGRAPGSPPRCCGTAAT